MSRRAFLAGCAGAAAAAVLPGFSFASTQKFSTLSFLHTHTGERMEIMYRPGAYTGSVQHALEYFLRDFRTDEVHPLDPALFDTLYAIKNCCGGQATFEVISGYRSPKTNAFLRKVSSGVAKRSLHMEGRAVDIRLAGQSTAMLRDLAVSIHDGGVGFYPKSNFIHIDTGRKRSW